MNKIIKIILTILFIILYFWASKIVDTEEIIGIKKYTGVLGHTEGTKNWVLDSNVCLLGKVVFFLWTIVVILNLIVSLNKKLLYFLAFLTIIITAALNMPLFIRAIPAFILLLSII